MNKFRTILSLAVLCSAINLVACGLLSDLEKHVANVNYAAEGGAVEVAIKALKSGSVKAGVLEFPTISVTVLEQLFGLKLLQEKGENFCKNRRIHDSLNNVAKMRKALQPNGPLDQAAKLAIEETSELCSGVYLDLAKTMDVPRIECMVEELAQADGLCKSDKTQPLWQHNCVRQIKKLGSKKLAQPMLNCMNKFEPSDRFTSLIGKDGLLSEVRDASYYYDFVPCQAYYSEEHDDALYIHDLILLNSLTGKQLTKEQSDLIERLLAQDQYCKVSKDFSDYDFRFDLARYIVRILETGKVSLF